jgi:hypothetical protein
LTIDALGEELKFLAAEQVVSMVGPATPVIS